MFMTKLKVAGMAFVVLGLVCLGAGMVASQAAGVGQGDAGPVRRGEPAAVLTLQQGNGQQGNQQNGQQGNQQNAQQDKKNDMNKDDGQNNQNDDGQKNNNNDGDKNNVNNGQVSQAFLKAVAPAKNNITVRRAGQKADETLDLAKPLTVVVGGKAATVADLKPGMYLTLTLTKDSKSVVRISQIILKKENGNQNQ